VVMPEEASAEVIRGTSDCPDHGNAITYYRLAATSGLPRYALRTGSLPRCYLLPFGFATHSSLVEKRLTTVDEVWV
jgi:hypothetical protein